MSMTSTQEPQSLRSPGASLGDFKNAYLTAAMLWVIAAVEWFAKFLNASPTPVAYASAALVATAFCTVKFVRSQVIVRHLERLRHAQRHVAEFLAELRRDGAQILHHLPAEAGNGEQVVITSRGIFVIQTKSGSKSHKIEDVEFDGAQIHVTRRERDATPIRQCKAATERIGAMLRDATCKTFKVRGILVFLDWNVTRNSSALGSEIWVLNPQELERWIGREPKILSATDIAEAKMTLSKMGR